MNAAQFAATTKWYMKLEKWSLKAGHAHMAAHWKAVVARRATAAQRMNAEAQGWLAHHPHLQQASHLC